MTTKNQEIIDAFNFRHATKRFNVERKINESDFKTIMDAGRLSPSSVGFEPWHFLIVQNPNIRKKLKEVSFGAQGQLDTASHFVIILARKGVTPKSDYVQDLLRNVKELPEDVISDMEKNYTHFQEIDLNLYESERSLTDWASKQTYIALANMMTTAALLGIDSCPIEGFNMESVTKILNEEGLLNSNDFEVSVMSAFGYRENEPKHKKNRLSEKEVFTWV